MQGFDVEGGDLVVGGRRLSALVAEVGQTPFYAYDRQCIARRVAVKVGEKAKDMTSKFPNIVVQNT